MEVKETLARLRTEAPAKIAAVESIEELDELALQVVGRNSPIAAGRRSLGQIPPEERRDLGRAINDVAKELEAIIEARRAELASVEAAAALADDAVDITLPGRVPRRGTTHLVQQVMDEVVDIFVAMGYTVATGPEAETEFYNFTALNFPPAHPTRLESDTLYLEYGDDPEGVLLRTHTSPMQARYMEQHEPPVYLVVPGRVFRRDQVDATHSPVFHQIEGLLVDEGVSFGHLKATLETFLHALFAEHGVDVRFRPSYFPFTEPSAEVDITCIFCGGSGCGVCSRSGWIEILGSGMVDPRVFAKVGIDAERYTGFAFGLGLDRVAMLLYGIPDLRLLFAGNEKLTRQFA